MRRFAWFVFLIFVGGIGTSGCADESSNSAKSTQPAPKKADPLKEFLDADSSAKKDGKDVPKEEKIVKLESGVKYIDIKEGYGNVAKEGKHIEVHYTGWLRDGTMFDNSLKNGRPLGLTLGANGVIKGWEQGIPGMKVGGKRKLLIPPALAYGEKGRPPLIPQNAELVFEIQLLSAD